MVGTRYGHVQIISPEKRWNQSWSKCYVLTRCVDCGAVQWTDLGNLRSGKSKGCQACSQPRRIPKWLDRRLTTAKQRCENPNDPEYHNYGARGIRFRFPSILAAGLYLLKLYPNPDRSLEIDRIDNNGDYAPGNLHLVTCRENNLNKRTTVLRHWDPAEWPYSYNVVIRKLRSGMTRQEILQDARKAVTEKRKNWRGIAAKLQSMIC